jgi:hypothetical protein
VVGVVGCCPAAGASDDAACGTIAIIDWNAVATSGDAWVTVSDTTPAVDVAAFVTADRYTTDEPGFTISADTTATK